MHRIIITACGSFYPYLSLYLTTLKNRCFWTNEFVGASISRHQTTKTNQINDMKDNDCPSRHRTFGLATWESLQIREVKSRLVEKMLGAGLESLGRQIGLRDYPILHHRTLACEWNKKMSACRLISTCSGASKVN